MIYNVSGEVKDSKPTIHVLDDDKLTVKPRLFAALSPDSRPCSAPSVRHQKYTNSRSGGKPSRTCAHANRQTMMDLFRVLPRTVRTCNAAAFPHLNSSSANNIIQTSSIICYYVDERKSSPSHITGIQCFPLQTSFVTRSACIF